MTATRQSHAVLVTGAAGYLGRLTIAALVAEPETFPTVVAFDVRDTPDTDRRDGVVYETGDIREPWLAGLMAKAGIDTVVHLAAIVTPPPDMTREQQYEIDVNGTSNVVESCLEADVGNLVVTSSGAAYGYHADNPVPLRESDPLRGNPEFAYSDHKRLVEELLAEARRDHPDLRQVVFRPGAILGTTVHNQISALFEQRVVVGIARAETPFCFVWDQDVVACLLRAIREDTAGVYNLTGDGTVTMREIAHRIGRPYLPVPAPVLRAGLALLSRVNRTPYGPEQVDFLRYRPVLDNRALMEEFGYTPRRTSAEAFEAYRHSRIDT